MVDPARRWLNLFLEIKSVGQGPRPVILSDLSPRSFIPPIRLNNVLIRLPTNDNGANGAIVNESQRWSTARLQNMGFFDSIKSMFSEGTKSLEEEVDRRDAELKATPQQRMEMLQDEIEGNDSAFDEIQSKIDRKGAIALAHTDLDEQELKAKQAATAESTGTKSPNDPTSASTDQHSTDQDSDITDAVLVDDDE